MQYAPGNATRTEISVRNRIKLVYITERCSYSSEAVVLYDNFDICNALTFVVVEIICCLAHSLNLSAARVGKKVFWFFGLFGFLAKSKKPAIVWFFAFWLFAQKWVYCWL